MIHTTRRLARTSTFPRAFAHSKEFYQAPLIKTVRAEANGKPYGWGIAREEQLGCQVANILLSANVDHDAKRVVRNSVAKALYSTACYGFNGSKPELHIAGAEPSYRNVRLPRLDIDVSMSADRRQRSVVDKIKDQNERAYPRILRDIEITGIFTNPRIERNARVMGECALQLAAIPLSELYYSGEDFVIQNFVAMTANTLKTDVARTTAQDNSTPSVRQFIRRGSPAMHELMGHPIAEVSDLAWEVCRDL
jgi:hypothetical protein